MVSKRVIQCLLLIALYVSTTIIYQFSQFTKLNPTPMPSSKYMEISKQNSMNRRIAEFLEIATTCNEKIASNLLGYADWNVENALELHFKYQPPQIKHKNTNYNVTSEQTNYNEHDEYNIDIFTITTNKNENENITKKSCLNDIFDAIFVITTPFHNKSHLLTKYQLDSNNIKFIKWSNHSIDIYNKFRKEVNKSQSVYLNPKSFFFRQNQIEIIKYAKYNHLQKILLLHDHISINAQYIDMFCKTEPFLPQWYVLNLGHNQFVQHYNEIIDNINNTNNTNNKVQYYISNTMRMSDTTFAISFSNKIYDLLIEEFSINTNINININPIDHYQQLIENNKTITNKCFTIKPSLILPHVESNITTNITNNNNIFISILICKTISFNDIDSTISDIILNSLKSFNETHYISLHWIIFIWDNKTYYKMEKIINLISMTNIVQLIYGARKLKHFFWQTYLKPDMITNNYFGSQNYDYIWLMDGDIAINEMNWNCFWYNIHIIYKPAIFQPSILNANGYIPNAREKHFRTTLYPTTCHTHSTSTNNIINQLFGIEVSFIEIQTPIFTFDAWSVFITEFNAKFTFIDSPSDWGLDKIWCNLINEKLLNQNKNITFNESKGHEWDETSCNVEYSDTNCKPKAYNIPCMIIQGIPVKHYDTKTHPVHNNTIIHELQYYYIQKSFEKYWTTDDDMYYRAFPIKQTNNIRCFS